MPEFTLTVQGRKPLSGILETGTTPPAGDNVPDPETVPALSWIPSATDKPCQIPGDLDFNDRDTWLPSTNMLQWPLIYDEQEGKVKIYQHPSLNLERNMAYAEWIRDCIGDRNWQNFVADGDGNMDGASLWGMKTLIYGTNIVNGIGTIVQAGSKFELLQTFDFEVTPVKTQDGWIYNGELIKFDTHPHLFVGRVNRNVAKKDTWQTLTGINYAIDKGEKDAGAKGTERWPFFSDTGVAMYHKDLYFFPNEPMGTLPFKTTVFKNSLIVDGNPVPQAGGLEITIVQLAITATACYGITDDWKCYKLEETLVRGTVEDTTAYGTALDWRVYSNYRGLNRRRAWQPDIGWTRGIDW